MQQLAAQAEQNEPDAMDDEPIRDDDKSLSSDEDSDDSDFAFSDGDSESDLDEEEGAPQSTEQMYYDDNIEDEDEDIDRAATSQLDLLLMYDLARVITFILSSISPHLILVFSFSGGASYSDRFQRQALKRRPK